MSVSLSIGICDVPDRAQSSFVSPVRYTLAPGDGALGTPSNMAALDTRSDTALKQVFLSELTSLLPALTADCAARDWQFARPPEEEADRLDMGYADTRTLDSARLWWMARPIKYRLWAVCDSHFRDRVLSAVRPMIEARQMLPAIERLLLALVDTSQLTEAQYIAGRVRSDSAARHIVAVATVVGDPHRYDRAITDLYHLHVSGYRTYRGRAFALLGRLYLVEGRLDEARRAGLEAKRLEKWAEPLLLTDVALLQGDTAAAVQALAFCRVGSGWCTNTPRRDSVTGRQLAMLYRAVNHGSLAGLDTVLKGVLRDPVLDFPVPITAWRGNGTTERVTLLQYYTWVHCGNCALHTIGAEALERRFGDHFIVLAYHYAGPLSVPGYRFEGGTGIDSSLHRLLHVGPENTTDRNGPRGWLCDWWVDGACMYRPVFTGLAPIGALSLYDQGAPIIERRLCTPPTVQLALRTTYTGNRIVAAITAIGKLAKDVSTPHPLKLQVVLVEDSVFIPGGNSPIQNHLVRAIAGDSAKGFGVLLPGGKKTQVVRETFDLDMIGQAFRRQAEKERASDADPSTWNPRVYYLDHAQLSVVAYVQDQTTGEVVQAVQTRLSTILRRP